MSQEVVKALLVEIDGNIEKLRKALGAGGIELEGFQKKATKSTANVGASADVAATKFAGAARAGASAFETIARTGNASGEAVKQLIAQGSNAALFFGPQGALVGALGIATLAIVGMFARTREEIAETQRAATEAANRLADMDANALGTRKNRLMHGSPFAQDISSIFDSDDEGKQREALRERGLDRLRRDATGRQQMIDALPSMEGYARLKQELDGIQTAIAELAAEEAILQPLMNARVKRDAEAARITREAAAATREQTEAERERKRSVEELNRESEQLAETTQRLIGGQFATLAERVRAPFDAAIAKAHELARAGQDVGANLQRADGLSAARDVAVRTAEALATAEQAMARFGQTVVERGLPAESALRDLKGAADDLRDEMADLVEGSEPYLKLLEKLQQLEKELAEALAKRADAQRNVGNGNAAPDAPKARDMADYAREVQQAADGALQLMQNLGGANAETVGLLRGIGQIAGNLPALDKALNPPKGESVSKLGVLSASLPILGALSSIATSLFGSSPADAARRKSLEENTEAIKALTEKAGQLGLGVTGSETSAAATQLRSFLRGYAPGVGQIIAGGQTFSASDQARVAAKAAGLSLSELDAIAEKHGITLNGSIESFLQLIDAIDITRMRLGEFGTDLDSQRRQADAEIAIRGITDPLEQLAVRMGAYAGRSGALDGVTAGLDLSTAEGRARARANAEALFAIMRAGGETLGEGALGGLSGDELLQALLDLVDSLDGLDETASAASGSTLGAVSGYTGLSAAAGSRIEDYNRALVGYARDAQGTRLSMLAALEVLVARTLGPIPVPPLFDGATARAGQGGVGVQITLVEGAIQLQFAVTGDARAIAAAAADRLEDGLSDGLARAIIRARQAAGDLSAVPA